MVEKVEENEEVSADVKCLEEAKKLKDMGNFFFKDKDYKQAIAKYSRVYLYLKAQLGEKGGENDAALAMASSK